MGFLLLLKYRNKQKLPRRGKTLDPNTRKAKLNQAGSGVSVFLAECPWKDRHGGGGGAPANQEPQQMARAGPEGQTRRAPVEPAWKGAWV